MKSDIPEHKQPEYPGDVLLKMYVSDPGRTTF